jgi:hypothetical protein
MKNLKAIIIIAMLCLPLGVIAQEMKTIEIEEFVITDEQFVQTLDSIMVFENECRPDTSTMWIIYSNARRKDTTQLILTKQTNITSYGAVIMVNNKLLFTPYNIDVDIIHRTQRKKSFRVKAPDTVPVFADYSTWVINYYNANHHIVATYALPCDKK